MLCLLWKLPVQCIVMLIAVHMLQECMCMCCIVAAAGSSKKGVSYMYDITYVDVHGRWHASHTYVCCLMAFSHNSKVLLKPFLHGMCVCMQLLALLERSSLCLI